MPVLTYEDIRQLKAALLKANERLSTEHYSDLDKCERRIKDLVAALFLELADDQRQVLGQGCSAGESDAVEDSFGRAVGLFVEAKKLKLEGDKETLKHFRS